MNCMKKPGVVFTAPRARLPIGNSQLLPFETMIGQLSIITAIDLQRPIPRIIRYRPVTIELYRKFVGLVTSKKIDQRMNKIVNTSQILGKCLTASK